MIRMMMPLLPSSSFSCLQMPKNKGREERRKREEEKKRVERRKREEGEERVERRTRVERRKREEGEERKKREEWWWSISPSFSSWCYYSLPLSPFPPLAYHRIAPPPPFLSLLLCLCPK